MFARAIADTLRFYRRGWWRLALVQLATGLALAASALVITGVASLVIGTDAIELTAAGAPDRGPVAALIFSVIGLMAIVGLPITVAGLATTVWLVDDTLAGKKTRTVRAFFVAYSRSWPLTAATVLYVVVALLLVALSPVISVLGIAGLAFTGVVLAVRTRRGGFLPRWPSARLFGWAAVPFGVALRWLVAAAFFIPALALRNGGPVVALRTGEGLLAGRLGKSIAMVVAVVVAGLGAQIALTALGSLLGGGGEANTGTLVGQVLAQSVLVALPVVVLTVLFRLAEATPVGAEPPASATAPYATGDAWSPKKRFVPPIAPARIRRTALLMPVVLLLAAFVTPVAGAQAAALTDTQFAVNTALDTVDAALLAEQQQNCAAAPPAGDCTLRAALAEAQSLATSGDASGISITFAGDYDIKLQAGTPLAFTTMSQGGGGEVGEGGGAPTATNGTLTISGAGHAVVLDGQQASRVLSFSSRGWGLDLFNLRIANGTAGSAISGGGLDLFAPGAESRVDSVTFDHNTAAAGGGLYSIARLAVVNSTFSSNSSVTSDQIVPGGADLYNSGELLAVNNSTFAGPSGGSIFNFDAGSGYATTLDNSFIVNSNPGAFNCTFMRSSAEITGSNNVVSGGDTSCPGTVPNSGPSLRPLASTVDNTPPVHVLAASTPGNPANAAIGAGGLGTGTVACAPVDQRGVARPAVGCAAGAVEYNNATRVALTSSANPENFGNPVSFTALVTAVDGGAPVAAGAVRFSVDGAPAAAPVSLSADGLARFSTGSIPVGTHKVTAEFLTSLPQSYANSATAAPLDQVIDESPITVRVVSSASPAAQGSAVTFAVTVASPLSLALPQGSVTLTDTTGGANVVVAENVPLAAVDGVAAAAITSSSLAVGRRTLVAEYSGDASFPAGRSAELAQVVQAPSSTEASVGDADVAFGAPVTVTLRVPSSHGAIVPTGSVEVDYESVGGPAGVTATLDATGAASLTIDDLSSTATQITARYAGDDVYAASSAAPMPMTVAPSSVSIVLATSVPGPVAFGTPVTFGATVRTTEPGSQRPPTGTVVFTVGGTAVGSAPLVTNGEIRAIATFTPSAAQLPVGAGAVVARFVPAASGEFVAAESAASTVTVVKAAPVVALTSSANPSVTGQQVALSAAVSAPAGTTGMPAGDVVFERNGTEIGRAAIVGSAATITVDSLELGTSSITARYAGSESFGSQKSGTLVQTVAAASVATRLDITPGGASSYGTRLELRGTATVVAPGAGSPTGSIVVTEGSTTIATIPLVGGTGAKTIVSPRVGDHDFVATYVPAGADYRSSSTTVAYSVGATNTSLALGFSTRFAVYGDPVTMTATVSSAGTTPEGTVKFFADGAEIGSAPVVAGVATLEAGLPSGYQNAGSTVSIFAVFGSEDGYNPSGASDSIVVNKGAVAVAITVGDSVSTAPTTITATVSVTSGRGPTPGVVQFTSRGEVLGSAPVVDGTAVLSTTTFAAGRNYVSAAFQGSNPNLSAADPANLAFDTSAGAPVPVLAGTSDATVPYGTPEKFTIVIPTTGVVPTGTVTLTSTGAGGTRDLATIPVTGRSLTAAVIVPAGNQSVTARYSGDFVYAAATSNALARTVSAAPTTLEAVGFSTAASHLVGVVGEPFTLRARVTNTASSASPTGVVAFRVGDTLLGTQRLSGVGNYGEASVQYVPTAKGSVDFRAEFTPDTGDFVASRSATAVAVDGRAVDLSVRVPIGAPTTIAIHDPFAIVAVAADGSGNRSSTRALPAGAVTIADSRGNSCTAQLQAVSYDRQSLAECLLTLTKSGANTVTASYAGDATFAAATSTRYALEGIAYAPRISLASAADSRQWVAGDTATVNWTVDGPPAGGKVVISHNGTDLCASTQLSGSCSYTFSAPSTTEEFSLDYTGAGKWSAATRSLSDQVRACIPLGSLVASPTNGGTVGTYSAPNCNNGRGFISGGTVGLFATPAQGFTFAGWEGSLEEGPHTAVIVPATGSISQTANFRALCTTVTVAAVVDYSLRDSNPAGVTVSPPPNCGSGWNRTDRMTREASYAIGTELTLSAVAPVLPAAAAPHVLYLWDGLGTLAAPLDVKQKHAVDAEPGGNRISAIFGVKCLHGISFAASTSGTAEISGPSCWDSAGPGYAAKSTVAVSTQSIGNAYFRGWSSNVAEIATGSDGRLGKGTVYVDEAHNFPVTAKYGECVSFSAKATGSYYNDRSGKEYPWGTISLSSPGNCASKGPGWYQIGTSLTVTTAWRDYDAALEGFTGEFAGQLDPARKSNQIVLDRSGTLTANFYAKLKCVAVGVTTRPAGALTASADLVRPGNGCPAGMLNYDIGSVQGGEMVQFTAKATSGDPMLGWSGSTLRPVDSAGTTVPVNISGTPQNPLQFSAYGTTSFTAWACQTVTPTVTLISPNGTPHSSAANIGGQFVSAASSPDCPLSANAYTVDQPVFLRAPGESTGYTFTGWSGAVTSTSIAPKTPVIVDGASRSIAVTASYQVHCFTLGTNRNELRTSIEPNCPDTPASESKYIGGTLVSFEATGSGDANFRGFTGSPDGQDGTLAWVTVDSDVTVYANYQARSIGEKIVDGFVSIGNNIAIGAKKAVGVAAAVAGAFIVGDNPVMLAANLVVLLGQAVQMIADQFGLSSAGLASFTAGIKHLSQTLDMINSTTTCTTAWALASNAAAAPTVKSATAQKIGSVMTDKLNAAQKATDAARQAEIYEQMVTVTMFKDAKAATAVADAGQETVSSTQRALSYLATKGTAAADAAKEAAEALKGPMQTAGQLGDVAMIGYKLYSDIDSGAAGWDADAESAWTKGQDVFMNCMTNSIPDYMGVPKTT